MTKPIPYPIVRTNRRTIALTVDREGSVTVRAPFYASEAEISRFVQQHLDWIEKAQSKQQQKKDQAPTFAVGQEMSYLGGRVQVRTAPGKEARLEGQQLLLPADGLPQTHALRWLTQQAKAYLPGRVSYWAGIMQIWPSRITIANPKTRWGSMKSDGSLRLNVALMHCDPALIDYVIVHELSHRVQMNHSPAFHAHVARYLPDGQQRRKMLKEKGAYLTLLRPEKG